MPFKDVCVFMSQAPSQFTAVTILDLYPETIIRLFNLNFFFFKK